MRIAAPILVLIVVVAIATEVHGWRRRRGVSKRNLQSAKRTVELADGIHPDDSSLLEDNHSSYKLPSLWTRDAASKSREKRALKPLQ